MFYPIGSMCPLNWMVWMMCSFSKHLHSFECNDTHNLYMRTFIHESICSWEHDSVYSWGHLFMIVFIMRLVIQEIYESVYSWKYLFMRTSNYDGIYPWDWSFMRFMRVFIHESIYLWEHYNKEMLGFMKYY